MPKRLNVKTKKGQITIELLIALIVGGLILLTAGQLIFVSLQSSRAGDKQNIALGLAQEGQAAVRAIKDEDWNNIYNLTKGSSYHPTHNGGGWSLSAGTDEPISGYTRSIVIDNVQRDESGNIVESGGTDDPSTQKVAVTVTANDMRDIVLVEYITFWRNEIWTQTDWSGGDGQTIWLDDTKYDSDDNNVEVNDPPGDLKLAPGGTWANACIRSETKFPSAGLSNDVFVVGNYAYLTVNVNVAGLQIFDVSDSQNPFHVGSKNLGNFGTGVEVSGNYAFLSVNQYDEGFQVLDVSDPYHPEVKARVDIGSRGNDIYVSGNYAYLAVDSTTKGFQIWNVSNPESPILESEVDLDGFSANGVFVLGSYAYVACSKANEGLKIYDVSNPSSPELKSTTDLGKSANYAFVAGDYAFLAIDSQSEGLKIYDFFIPESPVLKYTIGVDGKGNDTFVDEHYLFVAIDNNPYGVKIFDISGLPDSPPEELATVDIGAAATGVHVHNNILYISSKEPTKSFKIVTQGGCEEGEPNYKLSGYLISSAFNSGSFSRFNSISWLETIPTEAENIKFQIKTASDVGGSPSEWSLTWSGPEGEDGDETDYFEAASGETIHLDHWGDQWIKYKVILTGNGNNTPILHEVAINFTIY